MLTDHWRRPALGRSTPRLAHGISFPWARNPGTYAAAETKRFAWHYDSIAQGSSLAIARTAAMID
jgi:hypothetical protein